MKQFISITAVTILVCSGLFSQTKMIINKNDGTSDSLNLTEIKNITFKTYEDTVTFEGLTVGLVAYYPFNGSANDSSGNGYNGIVDGATLTTDRFNNPNSAYDFNGENNIIRCGDILDNIFCDSIAKFSISVWAKARTTSGPLPIITKSAGGSGPYQWTVAINNGLAKAEIFSDTLAHNYIQLTQPVAINKWYHFVLVFDGSLQESNRLKFYLNGQSDSVTVFAHVGFVNSSTTNSSQYVTIGATHNAGNPQSIASPFNGVIDDIRIYNRALSISEVQCLYNMNK